MAATIQLVPGSLDAAAKSEADGPLTLKVCAAQHAELLLLLFGRMCASHVFVC